MFFGIILGLILLLWLAFYLYPVSKTAKLHQFDVKRPLVIAHQGGAGLAPSSTLAAFMNAWKLGVDVLEFDVHMTKDGHIVSIHDPTVDRTTNGTGRVNDLTLEEIQNLDAGYRFQDEKGNYKFRGQGVFIPTIEQIFETIKDDKMLYIIEIKDTNHPSLYRAITEKMWDTIKSFGLEKRVILASFDQNIIDHLLNISRGEAIVSAGRKEAKRFVVLHKLFLNSLYRPSVDALHIPAREGKFNLADRKLIRGAHNRGMVVHYWTINDPEMMRNLLRMGADGIMTDRPDLLIQVMKENLQKEVKIAGDVR